MNTIGGVYRLDDGPVEQALARRISAAAQLLVSSRSTHWSEGPVALACVSPCVDGARLTDPHRSIAGAGHCMLVFDGRLDNRKDLVAELRRGGIVPQSRDADLVQAAYGAWGDECASKLIGDFAFGLWDGSRRRLLCVRDPLGVRPLYFRVATDVVCFATQLRQVLAASKDNSPSLDLEFIADRLVEGTEYADSSTTPYRGVTRLKPGHRLIAENGRVRTERYWNWTAGCGDASRDHESYTEQFRQVFHEAVEARMRGSGPVWSDLSGGLDSSSIVSVAARHEKRRPLRTISVIFGQSRLSDERQWMKSVAEVRRVEEHTIDGDVHHPFSQLREAVGYWEEPHGAAAFFGVHQEYARLVAGVGIGVPILLSGIGAEAVVMSKSQVPVHLADRLRRGEFAGLWGELDHWQRALRVPLSNLILRYCVRPLLSGPLSCCDILPQVHNWIARPFARRWGLKERARKCHMPSARGGMADQWQVERIGSITGILLRGYLEKACDLRYPFLHRPLVELGLEAPWSLKEIPGEPKALLRRAMRGVLPDEIRLRSQNVSTGHAVYNGLRKEWPVLERIVASSVLVDLGVVDRERLLNALHLARQGHAFDLAGLGSTLTLDAWLQHAAHKGGAGWLRSAA